jgi:DNA-directed RNA polymerase specialized sigma24 family protein
LRLTDAQDRRLGPAEQAELRELLDRLPADERRAVELMDLEGHTAMAAAGILGVPMTTVQGRRRSALQNMRKSEMDI